MSLRKFLLAGLSAIAADAFATSLDAGDHRCPDPERGLAILSPLESPDPCDSPVGGKPACIPYYPGYLRDPCCVYPVSAYSGYMSYGGPRSSSGPGYGRYSGARRDEANLLRLGGLGAARGPLVPMPSGPVPESYHKVPKGSE